MSDSGWKSSYPYALGDARVTHEESISSEVRLLTPALGHCLALLLEVAGSALTPERFW